MKGKPFLGFLVMLFVVGLAGNGLAKSNYLSSFNTKYGTSGTPLNTCSLCHPGGNTGSRNNFANDFANATIGNHTFNAVLEGRDSDSDGFTNLQEINARSFPGDAASKPDTTAPNVTAFTIPATSSSLTVSITAFTATDAVGVTGYMITETSGVPSASAAGWTGTTPASYVFATEGAKTLYGWAKDAAGNVSTNRSASVTITLPDTTAPSVTAFTIPATSSSLTVSITAFTATDAVGVTGYMITETSGAPSASAAGWTGTTPASYVFATEGAKTLYAWAKDAAGNVSTNRSASVTITLSDTTAPSITAFIIPGTATSLTVSITTFTATDAVGVTGYMIAETSAAPSASAAGWTGTAPPSYLFSTGGAKTLYAWAKDAAGNVSTSRSASVTITLPDTTAPSVTAFAIPAASTSLTVPITAFTATDAVGVTGYMITETSGVPSASAAGWTGTTPASYVFATEGAKTLYGWAKDAAGNVSTNRSASVTITLPDTTAPSVTAFTIPAASTSLTVPITTFTATDTVGVTGYMITETSAAPSASAAGWTGTAPTSYPSLTEGAKTLYGWAKDAAGNVSTSRSASVTITLPDTTAPNVTAFTIPATSSSLTVSITAFTATDAVGVTGYMITETSGAPSASAAGWTGTTPPSYLFSTEGVKTLYGWAKDAAGNVSTSRSASVTITLPDTTAPNVTAFTIPAASTSLTVPITTFTATDAVGVTGYMITETSAAPSASAAGWTGTAPASYLFSTEGAKTLYAWAKDAAGNVSTNRSASVTITLADTTAPNVTAFTIPATSSSLTVSITTFTATDAVGVTGYMITETSAAPSASAAGWTGTAPTSYSSLTEGAKTLYGWAKDAAGNVSTNRSASVTITLADTTAPNVTAFTIPATSSSLIVSITAFTATDAVGVTGYMITETSGAPSASAAGWTGTTPPSYLFSTEGAKTLYGWAKDAAGNVSTSRSASVTITLPDTTAPNVTTFAIPATSASLTVSITTFTATDAVGVTGYMIAETSGAPSASAAGWTGTTPVSYVFTTEGVKTLYAWAKDAAGNVSTNRSASVTITLPDTTAPNVTAFTIPATSSSLTVSITAFTATDAVGVTGYMITETSGVPSASAAGWTGTAPTSYSSLTEGAKTLYGWAKDAAGNVSTNRSASVTITLADTTAPNVTAFTIPATSSSLTVSITAFTATDAVGVTGYMITETSGAPSASAAGWTGTTPPSYLFSTEGAKTLYAWAKDAAGNVSTSRSASVTITLPDTTAPNVTTFAIPATSASLTVSITTFTATDAVGVTGYMIAETSGAPSASAAGWTGTAPASYLFSTEGAKTLYAWAKDAAGNVSTNRSASVTITLPDTTAPSVTAFTIPATSSSLTVSITAFTATDAVGVTGYMITETSAAPSASAAGWTGTAPTSYSSLTEGAKTLYAWAKDAAGNVSTNRSASVTITLPDTTAPSVTAFTIPATSSSLTVSITAFTATDAVGVTGYMITETSGAPSASAAGWTGTTPASYVFATEGAKTLYAWAKDAAGNVSTNRSASVTITLPDTTAPSVTAFAIPAASTSLTVPITTFTATDTVGVTGYMITETSAAPSASAAGWTGTAPTSYSSLTEGAKALYAWAKDAAGNVSTNRTASVTITPLDPNLPDLSDWNDKWFKVTIQYGGYSGEGLTEDRQTFNGYLKLGPWDPASKAIGARLYGEDTSAGATGGSGGLSNSRSTFSPEAPLVSSAGARWRETPSMPSPCASRARRKREP